MIRTPVYYQRRARRFLMLLAFYWTSASAVGLLLYVAYKLYLPLFV